MRFPPLKYVPVEEYLTHRSKGCSVLHLGCAGDYLRHGPNACLHYRLASQASYLTGIELDALALETVKQWVPESDRIRYVEADVQRLGSVKFPRQFDLILAASIIEHLDSPGQMLKNIKPFLNRNGSLVIVTPHNFGLLEFLRVAFRRYEACHPQHTCWFSISTLAQLCRRNGFTATEWLTGFGWRPETRVWQIQRTLGRAFFSLFPHLGGSLIGVFKLSGDCCEISSDTQ